MSGPGAGQTRAGAGAPGEVVGAEGVAPSVFHAAYSAERAGQPAAWEIGRAQPVVVALADAGAFGDPLLDLGCGTGANAIALAQRGLRVTAVDFVPQAVEAARARAMAALGPAHGIDFAVADALALAKALPGRAFDTVLDSAVFHVFGDADRPRYRASIDAVTRVGSKLFVIVFSPAETRPGGPRRVGEGELADALAPSWQLVNCEPCRYETNIHEGGSRAICAAFVRAG